MDFVKKITLEDNKEYIIVDEIICDSTKYVYMINEEDISKLCIRKVSLIDKIEHLIGLKDEEEFQKALNEYIKKHRQ